MSILYLERPLSPLCCKHSVVSIGFRWWMAFPEPIETQDNKQTWWLRSLKFMSIYTDWPLMLPEIIVYFLVSSLRVFFLNYFLCKLPINPSTHSLSCWMRVTETIKSNQMTVCAILTNTLTELLNVCIYPNFSALPVELLVFPQRRPAYKLYYKFHPSFLLENFSPAISVSNVSAPILSWTYLVRMGNSRERLGQPAGAPATAFSAAW